MAQNTTQKKAKSGIKYECPICSVSYTQEEFVRAHIALSTDENHKNKHGFMPEDTIRVVDDSELINEVSGDGKYPQKISTEKLPNDLTVVEKTVLKTTIENLNFTNYSELVRKVNEELESNNIETKSYTFIVEFIKEFLMLEDTYRPVNNNTMNAEKIDSKEREVLLVYKEDPSLTPSKLAEKIEGVDSSSVVKVLEKHEELLDNMSNESVSEETENKKSELEKGIESSFYDDYDLTPKQKRVIEYIARNPNATNREASKPEAGDCAISYPSRIRDVYSDIIIERLKDLGKDLSEFEDSKLRREKKRANSFEELKYKQKKIIERLSQEDDPLNPDSSLRDMLDDIDIDTYPAYLSDVKDKYGHLAMKLKEERKDTINREDKSIVIKGLKTIRGVTDEFAKQIADEYNISSKDEFKQLLIEKPELLDKLSLNNKNKIMNSLDIEQEIETNKVEKMSEETEEETLESLLDYVKEQKELASLEVEYSDSNDSAAARRSLAEEIEQRIVNIVEPTNEKVMVEM